jgi:hypothetical protein
MDNQQFMPANHVYGMLQAMPAWKDHGITIKDQEPYVEFTKGEITIKIPYIEVLIFGAKTILYMFKCLDK